MLGFFVHYDYNDSIQYRAAHRHYDNGAAGAIMSTQQGVNATRASGVEAQRQIRRKANGKSIYKSPKTHRILVSRVKNANLPPVR